MALATVTRGSGHGSGREDAPQYDRAKAGDARGDASGYASGERWNPAGPVASVGKGQIEDDNSAFELTALEGA